MSLRDEVIAANRSYAESFQPGDLSMSPERRLVVVTCMDARIDPARSLGLAEGDAHVLRNAGGLVTDDVLRSLVISRTLLETEEAFVIGHSDCGMRTFSNDDLHTRLRAETGADATQIDFEPFRDVEASVREGVRKIEESPFLPGFRASGWIFDVETGRLRALDV